MSATRVSQGPADKQTLSPSHRSKVIVEEDVGAGVPLADLRFKAQVLVDLILDAHLIFIHPPLLVEIPPDEHLDILDDFLADATVGRPPDVRCW